MSDPRGVGDKAVALEHPLLDVQIRGGAWLLVKFWLKLWHLPVQDQPRERL
jgi:hypothetical protein